MSKQTGLGDKLIVGGYDLSGDTQAINSASGGPAVIDCTSIEDSAMSRLGGLRDGRLEATAFFNDAADQAHPVYSALPTTDIDFSYLRGTTAGNAAASLTAKQINYDGNRGPDGEFTLDVAAESNKYGLQWGDQLTAGVHQSTGAENLASVDLTTVSTDLGGQAFLHVVAFTGTSCTVTIEDSADDAAFALVTGLTFTAATAVGSERVATGATENVRRYIRAVASGTFSVCDFVVVFARNTTATVF